MGLDTRSSMKTGLVMLALRCMRMLMGYKSMLSSFKKGESVPVEGGFKLSVKLC
jgi:hypothetical protein